MGCNAASNPISTELCDVVVTKVDFFMFVFGINTNPKILCPEDLFQANHELQHLQRRPFSSSFGWKEKNHYLPQLVADHFQASGRRISATTVRNRLHNAGLYARSVFSLNGRQRRNRLCWAREHVSWTQQQWASVLFTYESRFTLDDSGRSVLFTLRVIQGVY
ncbi:HTH_Tnp_Tc3_2 domain-containing protein [Trichonephila clavipes]|nr:HTH_Tnp_Tc3_2 domain-containing protein [Trichonephila clavipes]